MMQRNRCVQIVGAGLLLANAGCEPPWHAGEVVDDRPHFTTQDPQPACAIAGSSTIVVFNRTISMGPSSSAQRTWARVWDGTAWHPFDDLGGAASGPNGQAQHVAGSADGTAIAIVHDGVTRYSGGAWSVPAPVSDASRVAMDATGHGLVVGASPSEVRGSFFDPATGWGSSFQLSAATGDNLAVAMNAAGGAVVGWCAGGNTWANVCGPDHVWSGATSLHPGCSGFASLDLGTLAVSVGLDGSGKAFVASTGAGVQVSVRDPATGTWSSSLSAAGSYTNVKLAVNEAGLGLLAYSLGALPADLKGRVYHPASGWGAEAALASGLLGSSLPTAGLDSFGRGHIAYVVRASGGGFNDEVHSIDYDPGADNFMPTRLLETFDGVAYYLSGATAENGDSVVAWQGGSAETIYAARYGN